MIAVILNRLKRILLPLLAGIVIILALLVGVARLLLPQVPQYRDDIQRIAEAATGFQVEFGSISAGVSRHGPQLRLQDSAISVPGDDAAFLEVAEIRISLDLVTLALSQTIVPGHTQISGVAINVARTADGKVKVQDRLLSEWLRLRGGEGLTVDDIPDTALWLSDVTLNFTDDFLQRAPAQFRLPTMVAELEDGNIQIEGEVEPEQRFGRNIGLFIDVPLAPLLEKDNPIQSAVWKARVTVPDLDISEWLALFPDDVSPVVSGSGSGIIRGTFRGGIPLEIGADIDLEDISLLDTDSKFNHIAGSFDFRHEDHAWRVQGDNVILDIEDRVWPASNFLLEIQEGDKPGSQNLLLRASYLNFNDLSLLVSAAAGKQLSKIGLKGVLEGEVKDLDLVTRLVESKPELLEVNAEFSDLGYVDSESGIDIRGLNGTLSSDDDEGYLYLKVADQTLLFEPLFRGAAVIDKLSGVVVWRARESGITLIANNLRLLTPFGQAQANMELSLPFDAEQGLYIDLKAQANVDDLPALRPVMPKVIPPTVLTWLDDAIVSGRSRGATFQLNGNLRDFPFAPGESGVFLITVPFEEGTLNFAPGWPQLEQASGTLVFDGVSMYTKENAGVLAGTSFSNADARIDDLRIGEVQISSSVVTGVPNVLRLLRESPLSENLGPTLGKVEADGNVSGSVEIYLPIKQMSDWRFASDFRLVDGSAALQGLDFDVTDIVGDVQVRQTRLLSENLRGQLLGNPVDIKLADPGTARKELSQLATLTSVTPVKELARVFKLPFPERLSGSVDWTAEAQFPSRRDGVERDFQLVVNSDMKGVAVDLPAPVYKSSDVTESVELVATFPEANRFDLMVDMQRELRAGLIFSKADENWRLAGGIVHLGNDNPAAYAEVPGVTVSGRVASLNLSDWLELGEGKAAAAYEGQPWYEVFTRFDLFAYELDVFGFSFPKTRIGARGVNNVWIVDAEGEHVDGRMAVPNELLGDEALMLDMQRLNLKAIDGDAESGRADPRELPRLIVQVDDFILSDMRFGYLEAEVARIENGLQIRRMFADAGNFNLNVDGDWQLLDAAADAHRTRVKFRLESKNVAKTLEYLGFEALVEAKEGSANADLTWDDAPGMGLLYQSRGNFGFRVDNGQILNVDPGGGRLLGLMSLTSLPRRLSLDFRDVFDDGLGFDKLKGTFRLQEGTAHTCNVSLSGSVTDMVLIGSSDLENETYNQLAVIRPHMSNMLPLGTAVVAGPAIGAAVLLVAAVFKDPLSNIGATYYRISDSWDNPKMDEIDRDEIDRASFEDCEATLPELSVADIEALRELREAVPDKAPVEMPQLDGVATDAPAVETSPPQP